MLLFHPHKARKSQDTASAAVLDPVIEFFTKKGLAKIKADDETGEWHHDFISFVGEHGTFASLLTPREAGGDGHRFDMWRVSAMNEILGYYGLSYWYAWQVTILGLGPIWMTKNRVAKEKAKRALQDGGIFAFGLSERANGADIYSTRTTLTANSDGSFTANGSKYYIGNGNKAAYVSTFGKIEGTGEYVFFLTSPADAGYRVDKKIKTSGVRPAFVASFSMENVHVPADQILARGDEAWNMALNTVNVGKFQLGFASIGIATHAFYEAIGHASTRTLYGQKVTDFPHVKKLFAESYARLVAMRLYGLRATDYLRAASPEDRRYLLYNPIMKMKVTSEGEKVVGMLHDVIAAKGFEQDTYFEMAIRDIGMLPKLEGTVHVNMALVIKFIKNYFFGKHPYPAVPRLDAARDDSYLFAQVSGGLGEIPFPDYRPAFQGHSESNVAIFCENIADFRDLLINAGPTKEQASNVDFMLANGELFTLIAYGQLILENCAHYPVTSELKNQIFGFLVRDFAAQALKMQQQFVLTAEQKVLYQKMMRLCDLDSAGFDRLWQNEVLPLAQLK